MNNIIADSSTVIAFIKKGELHLLKDVFTTIHLPAMVHDELTSGKGVSDDQMNQLLDVIRDGWIIVDNPVENMILKPGCFS